MFNTVDTFVDTCMFENSKKIKQHLRNAEHVMFNTADTFALI